MLTRLFNVTRVASNVVGSLAWTYQSYTLTIEGNGNLQSFESQGSPWYEHASSIRYVIVGDGVKTIGSYAFQEVGYCGTKGVSIEIGTGVTSIANNAFESVGQENRGAVTITIKSKILPQLVLIVLSMSDTYALEP